MKVFFVCCLVAVTLCGVAAPFQNLGFDDSTSGLVSGWQIISGSNTISSGAQIDGVPFGPPADIADVFLFTPNNPNQYPVVGKYSLVLVPAFDFGRFTQSPASISQIGDIPSDAKSIEFINFLSSFELRVNGNLIPLTYEISPGSLYPTGVGDISGYAGQTVELKFTTIPHTVLPPFGVDHFYYGIDSITFSPDSIPEPSTWALLGLGGTCLLFRWRFLRCLVSLRRA
jgi:hypothetical protein